jgi:phosphomannomutase
MNKLTIEQKKGLLNMAGYKEVFPANATGTMKTPIEYMSVNHYEVLPNGGYVIVSCNPQTVNGVTLFQHEDFVPLKNMNQAMILLDSLAKESNEHWKINFSVSGEKRLYCQPRADFMLYNKYGNDLCSLIVNACLWWLENKKEE